MRIDGQWSSEIAQQIIEKKIAGLILIKGSFEGNSVEFLRQLPFLKYLTLIYWKLDDPSPVQELTRLKYLNLITWSEKEIDFSKFTSLEKLSIEWSPGLVSGLEVKSLKSLFVNRLPKKHLPLVGKLPNLEYLGILSCAAGSLDCLSNLKKLESLRLALFPKLGSNDFLRYLHNLEEIDVGSCSGFYSMEPLAGLKKLRRLGMSNLRTVESLRPLSELPLLERVSLLSTKLLDKDVSFFDDMPNFKEFVT